MASSDGCGGSDGGDGRGDWQDLYLRIIRSQSLTCVKAGADLKGTSGSGESGAGGGESGGGSSGGGVVAGGVIGLPDREAGGGSGGGAGEAGGGGGGGEVGGGSGSMSVRLWRASVHAREGREAVQRVLNKYNSDSPSIWPSKRKRNVKGNYAK